MPDEFVTPCINKNYLTLPYLTNMAAEIVFLRNSRNTA